MAPRQKVLDDAYERTKCGLGVFKVPKWVQIALTTPARRNEARGQSTPAAKQILRTF